MPTARRRGGFSDGVVLAVPGDPRADRPAETDDVRLGLVAGFPGLGERPVDGGDRRVLSGVLAGLDGQLLGDLGDEDATVFQHEGVWCEW
ncbi:hypothetical protein [Streptomyces sp. NK08204]|uniref:hypothetical protein n=1 Tax=Streptomyces sp. NK08204 TaxID=2873260 RepID=UPI001CECE3BB|nr:hypothetical protein [Streptomyces sp. NK08204]